MNNTMILGGRFLHHDYRDDAGMFEGQGFWGYNTTDGHYEGLWIDSTATCFQLERGHHDAATDSYHMAGSMTDPAGGKPLKKRSLIRLEGPDAHALEMYFQPEGGPEFKGMEIRYQRA
jgi:hypothetical protein